MALAAASSLLTMAQNEQRPRERSRSRKSKSKPNDSDDEGDVAINSYYATLGFSGGRGYPLKRRKYICKEIFGKKLNLVAQASSMNAQRTDRLIHIGTGLGPDTDLINLKTMSGNTHAQLTDALVGLSVDRRAIIAELHANCDNIEEVSDRNGWCAEWLPKYKADKMPGLSGRQKDSSQKLAAGQLKASLNMEVTACTADKHSIFA